MIDTFIHFHLITFFMSEKLFHKYLLGDRKLGWITLKDALKFK